MRLMMLAVMAATLATAPVPAAAADARTAFDQIIADAQRVRQEAQDVKQLLRSRDAGQALVLERVGVLETHARALKESIGSLNAAAGLDSTQLAAVERARLATESLLVLLENKRTLIADAQRMQRQRGLLRDKATAIVARARLVEQQMARARG